MNFQEFLARKKSASLQPLKLNQDKDNELSNLREKKGKSYAFREKIPSQKESLEND